MTIFLLAQIGRRWLAEWRLDRATDAAGAEAAAALDGANDQHWARWARRLDEEGRPGLPGWLRAAAANPRRGEWLIEAALESEAAGNQAQAERLLLRAERFNRMWGPRWALACYYVRHGRKQEALKWAKAAAARAFADRTALFALCREAGADDRWILDEVAGEDPGNLGAFVRNLAQNGVVELAGPAALRYLESRRKQPHRAGRPEEALETVEIAMDALLMRHQGEAAVQVASELGRLGWAGYGSGGGMPRPFNPDFRPPWTGHGFGWRHGEAEGMEVRPAAAGEGVRISFSGRQPEAVDLLAQLVHLERAGTWELALEYLSRDLAPAQSGVGWHLEPIGAPTSVGAAAEAFKEPAQAWTATEWAPRRLRWQVTEGGGVFRLILTVRRPVGQPRVEGELGFRRLALRRLGEPGQ